MMRTEFIFWIVFGLGYAAAKLEDGYQAALLAVMVALMPLVVIGLSRLFKFICQ